MASEAKKTTDHETIKQWTLERQGHPAHVKETGDAEDPGILRIDFERPDPGLEELGWDEFFEKFDQKNLLFLYQERTEDGHLSRFHKFVDKDTAEAA